jgi:hypothetical protein
MATKNLSRTVIEGGRAGDNRWDRRRSNKQVRVAASAVLAQLRHEMMRDGVVLPRRKPVRKCFRDKLGPARRWLARQVGRPWNAVRSEVFTRFDTRSTPGRHIVFDHLLPWVEHGDRCFMMWAEFAVDRHGILRRVTHPTCAVSDDWRRVLPDDGRDLERWLDGRLVAERGGALFWFVATPFGAFRQHASLTESDGAVWRALPKWFRDERSPRI